MHRKFLIIQKSAIDIEIGKITKLIMFTFLKNSMKINLFTTREISGKNVFGKLITNLYYEKDD